MQVNAITSECPQCGVTFEQPDDPGRRRKFCSNRCRQADYRARSGKTGHEARQEKARREQERRERDARRARERRARERREQASRTGERWTWPNSADTTAQARARSRARKLLDRANHRNTGQHEAQSCREKAETIRTKYGL